MNCQSDGGPSPVDDVETGGNSGVVDAGGAGAVSDDANV